LTVSFGCRNKVIQNSDFLFKFPPFSNNEIGLTGGNSRREIGHGKPAEILDTTKLQNVKLYFVFISGSLAEKALMAVVPQSFPFTTRLTSQVMMSNGKEELEFASTLVEIKRGCFEIQMWMTEFCLTG
jgi:polyribonucleotide nucleotidyltransferase